MEFNIGENRGGQQYQLKVILQILFSFSSEMTSNDCFELGRQSYLNKDFYHTLLWMNEAMQRLHNDTTEATSTSKADILEYLAFAVFKQGEYEDIWSSLLA